MTDRESTPTAPPDAALWTVEDVAAYLRVSVRTVYSLPGLPRITLQGRGARRMVRYAPAEVRAYAAQRLTHSVLPIPDTR